MDKVLVTKASMPPYEEYIEKIKPLWESHWITNMGNYHIALENKLREYLKVPQLSLMVNGHMALELAIQTMNFPKGSEVITTPFTFISTTHAIVRNGLVPVFCDIKMEDYTIDENRIESLITERTVAIVPVHVYGNICNMDEIEKIAKNHNIKVIYDAAHAFGESYCGKGVGNFGDASIFSFHATKVFNSIEGGAVTFSDYQMYERLYNLKNFGIRNEELVEEVGANAKMNEFSAIMGLCNLGYVDDNIQRRKDKVKLYLEKMEHIEGIYLQKFDRRDIQYNYGYFPIRFDSEEERNKVYEELKKYGIYTRKYFYPLTSDAECYKNKFTNTNLENARLVANTILVLPLYPELEDEVIKKITSLIQGIIKEQNGYKERV